MTDDELATVFLRVQRGRRFAARQRERVERLLEKGRNVSHARRLLCQYEASLENLEADLARRMLERATLLPEPSVDVSFLIKRGRAR